MTSTKLVLRAAATLAVFAFAAPALPCSDMKQTSASFQPVPTPAPSATPAPTPKDAVAKQTAPADKAKGQGKSSAKKTTAAN